MRGKSENITKFQKTKKTMVEVLCKLVADDGMTLHQIVKSEFMREAFAKFGWDMPESSTTLSTIIQKQAKKVEESIKFEIADLLAKGVRFSVIMDEWTSRASKRFLSVLLTHKEAKINLGVVELEGTANAENLAVTLQNHLNKFGVSLEHNVVAITSDGASVMTKMHKSLPTEMQLCHAHAIHLAVCDVFISKKPSKNLSDEEQDFEANLKSNYI